MPHRDCFYSGKTQQPLSIRLLAGVCAGTDRYFLNILWDSLRFYAHAPRRFQKILHVQSYRVIFQLFLEGSIHLRCIQWARASSVIWELTHFHRLHQQYALKPSLLASSFGPAGRGGVGPPRTLSIYATDNWRGWAVKVVKSWTQKVNATWNRCSDAPSFLLPRHPVLITPPPDSFDSVPRLFPTQLLDLSPSSSESPIMHQLSFSSTRWSTTLQSSWLVFS